MQVAQGIAGADEDSAGGEEGDWEAAAPKKRAQRCSGGRRRISVSRQRKAKAHAGAAEAAIDVGALLPACIHQISARQYVRATCHAPQLQGACTQMLTEITLTTYMTCALMPNVATAMLCAAQLTEDEERRLQASDCWAQIELPPLKARQRIMCLIWHLCFKTEPAPDTRVWRV